MIIKKSASKEFPICPEYDGLAKIVDMTELKTYITPNGNKEKFRFILEICEQDENGRPFTVATQPFTPSLHEKAALRKFVENVTGEVLSDAVIGDGFDPEEELIGAYCKIIVEHRTSADKTYANITYVGHPKTVSQAEKWESKRVRLQDRESHTNVDTRTFQTPVAKKKAGKAPVSITVADVENIDFS